MKDRQYYSRRKGLDPRLVNPDLPLLRELFVVVYKDFERKDYFNEAFGYWGPFGPDGWAHAIGRVGDEEAYFFRRLKKHDLWPIENQIEHYSEDDLFDVIELLHDLVSQPLGATNSYGGYKSFDQAAAQREFRNEMNEILRDYPPGYELSPDGKILLIGDVGMQTLFEAELPEFDPENVEERVKAAIRKFRRRGSTLDDRRDAVKSLADVLEFLRPRLHNVITSKDESDLFHLVNKFGIRHHRVDQKTDYDRAVWLSCMFYYFLAVIHTVTRLLEKAEEKAA